MTRLRARLPARFPLTGLALTSTPFRTRPAAAIPWAAGRRHASAVRPFRRRQIDLEGVAIATKIGQFAAEKTFDLAKVLAKSRLSPLRRSCDGGAVNRAEADELLGAWPADPDRANGAPAPVIPSMHGLLRARTSQQGRLESDSTRIGRATRRARRAVFRKPRSALGPRYVRSPWRGDARRGS
jgi:hypothetical protein